MADSELDLAFLISRIEQLEQQQNVVKQYLAKLKHQLDAAIQKLDSQPEFKHWESLQQEFVELKQRFEQILMGSDRADKSKTPKLSLTNETTKDKTDDLEDAERLRLFFERVDRQLNQESLEPTDIQQSSESVISATVTDYSNKNNAEANLQGANLTSAKLNGSDLRTVSLKGANLTLADLQNAKLIQANLSFANLSEANFMNASLIAANLTHANFTNTNLMSSILIEANLSKANLKKAKISDGTNLIRADLSGTNLVGVTLQANLSGANLSSANICGANLYMARLSGANLTSADLRGANICGANLYMARLSGANLTSADLRGANLELANLENANLRGANISGANLGQGNRKVKLRGAIMPDGTVHE